jgi:hypothetical protein
VNVRPLRTFLIIVGVLGFAALQTYFLVSIITASTNHPPNFADPLVPIQSALSGALAAAFAVALGVKDTTGNPGFAAFRAISQPLVLTVGIWLYAVFGVLSVVVYVIWHAETPGAVASLALVFVGYVGAVLSNAYKTILPVQGEQHRARA